MKGSEHYREGERLLSQASWLNQDGEPIKSDGSRFAPGEHCALVDRAMAHFAAAQVAATTLPTVVQMMGDSSEVTAWAHAIGVAEEPADPPEPPRWPPIAGDTWTTGDIDAWGPQPVWLAQGTPDGVRMVPANVGDDYDSDAVLSPDELLKRGDLTLLHRNPWEPPF